MQVVRLTTPYRTANTLHNIGEFAGFTDKEARHIIEKRYGILAKSVRILKPVSRAEADKVLGKSMELRKGARVGQCLTLEADRADDLIKSGGAIELIQITVREPFKDEQGNQRDSGTFAATRAELKSYGPKAEPFVHPTDEQAEEAEELAEADRAKQR